MNPLINNAEQLRHIVARFGSGEPISPDEMRLLCNAEATLTVQLFSDAGGFAPSYPAGSVVVVFKGFSKVMVRSLPWDNLHAELAKELPVAEAAVGEKLRGPDQEMIDRMRGNAQTKMASHFTPCLYISSLGSCLIGAAIGPQGGPGAGRGPGEVPAQDEVLAQREVSAQDEVHRPQGGWLA